MKYQIVETCNDCKYHNNNMYGIRCFNPKVTKSHPDGVTPKTIPNSGTFVTKIPKWCPLDNKLEEQYG